MPRVRVTDLVTWHHCRKKFEYKLARGWEVQDDSKESTRGTAFHAGMADWYTNKNEQSAVASAIVSLAATEFNTLENQYLVEDMVRYFIANNNIDISETISTEEELEMTLLCPMDTAQGPQLSPFTIVGHLDLVARDSQGQLIVLDHKSKKRMPGDYEWFQLSTQMKIYALMAYQKYKEVPKVIHNVIRQEVPPGFGHRELKMNKNGTVSKRNASQAVNDYIRQFSFKKSEDTLAFYEADLRSMCKEIILAIMGAVRYERSEGTMCEYCPYLQVCLLEDTGQAVTNPSALLLDLKKKEQEEENAESETETVGS